MLLAVDPGTKHVAYAQFDEMRLDDCGLWRSNAKELVDRIVDFHYQLIRSKSINYIGRVVVELPVVYGPGKTRNPADLIDLTLVAGSFIPLASVSAVTQTPAEWKGQRPKHVCQRHIEAELRASERGIINKKFQNIPKSLRHNVWDAIGLGMSHLGRIFGPQERFC